VNAVVSGHAGVALLIDGKSLSSIHFGGDGEVVPRSPTEIHLLLSGADDLRFLENVKPEQVREQLDLESTRIDALHLALILQDAELSEETRRTAAEELDEMLSDKDLLDWLEGVLYAHPLPASADLPGARTACMGQTRRTQVLLEKLELSQEAIAEVHRAWVGIPTHVFGSEQDRANALAMTVREGLFRDLVKHRVAGDSLESFLSVGFSNPSWQKFESHRAILDHWITAFQDDTPTSAAASSMVAEHETRERNARYKYVSIEELLRILHSSGGGQQFTKIVRHLLAGRVSDDLKAAVNLSKYTYDEAFASAERSLDAFFAVGTPPEQSAESLLEELLPLLEDDQIHRVGTESRFAHPSFVERLIDASQAVRYKSPTEMFHLAHLARLAAEACPARVAGSERKRADLQARALMHYGNASRVSDRLAEAEEALASAQRWSDRGTRDPLLRAKLFEVTASLRISQRRYREAVDSAESAAEIYRELEEAHSTASALVQKSIALLYANEPEEAIDVLNRAIPLIPAESNPNLLLAACHNLVQSYISLDQPEKGLSLYFEIRGLYKEFDDDIILLRTGWQEGQLLRDLGHLDAAEAALLQARKGFVERNLAPEVALVSLDLAGVYVKLGRIDSLKQTITEAIPIFSALRVGREAISALLQLQHAEAREQQALDVISALRRQFFVNFNKINRPS
jgi:tetratricopeptide (TPR) repeat protein